VKSSKLTEPGNLGTHVCWYIVNQNISVNQNVRVVALVRSGRGSVPRIPSEPEAGINDRVVRIQIRCVLELR
jgi:hypothetical protein